MSILTPLGGGHLAIGAAPTDAAGASTTSAADADATNATASANVSDVYINPQFAVDAQSGAVILQYRDDTGKLVRQVPNEYELRSYQRQQDEKLTPA